VDFDNLFILLIIFSFIARVIGDALKGGKKPPGGAPPGRRPLPRPDEQSTRPQPRPPGRMLPDGGVRGRAPARAEAPARPAPERASDASDMIPDELWQILTGQPRPPARPRPVPVPVPDEADEDEELIPDEESLLVPEVSTEDRDAAELIKRRRAEVARRERGPDIYRPKVVSLEREPLPTAARHAAFHVKHDPQAAAKVLHREPPPGLARIMGTDAGALRRAIILNEVLGRPKGLE
jgi:hypothetical protein